MGGSGSGNYYRWDKCTTKEELKRIDIRYMKKVGMLLPNHKGTLSWNCNGEPSGEIGYTRREDKMIVNYALQEPGNESESVEQIITVSRTSCNYGGERAWLHCPLCQTRARHGDTHSPSGRNHQFRYPGSFQRNRHWNRLNQHVNCVSLNIFDFRAYPPVPVPVWQLTADWVRG